MARYRTRVPAVDGELEIDVTFKNIENWAVEGSVVEVVHGNALDKKFLKAHPNVQHEVIVEPEEEE